MASFLVLSSLTARPLYGIGFRANVEAPVNQKIPDAVYSMIRHELVGLGEVLKQYLAAVTANPPNREHIRTIFTVIDSHLVHDAPDFAWPLLPLFAMSQTLI